MNQTTWAIRPLTQFAVGDVLLPMREFPENSRMVRVRRNGEYEPCGVIEGDGATELMRRFIDPLPAMVVKSVSEVSGWACARLQMHEIHDCPRCKSGVLFDAGGGTLGLRCTNCGHAEGGGAQGSMCS